MTREEMLTKVIKVRGFEDKYTIYFASLINDEKVSDNALKHIMATILYYPFEAEPSESELKRTNKTNK